MNEISFWNSVLGWMLQAKSKRSFKLCFDIKEPIEGTRIIYRAWVLGFSFTTFRYVTLKDDHLFRALTNKIQNGAFNM